MIPYGKQSINGSDIKAVRKALKRDFLTTGPLVQEFETQLARIVGAETVVVNSGTAALHSVFAAIGIKPGDEVVTPPITFAATQTAAAHVGARIRFADVKSDFPNINPRKVEEAITSNTRAIVAVDFGGKPADLDELRILADRYGIFLIEDASHSIGSLYKGSPVGSIADFTTFSFFPTKNLTTGEGGAFASTHPELLEKARIFSRQGIVRNINHFQNQAKEAWRYEIQELGLNYRLPDILCALGLSQLKRLDKFKSRKQKLIGRYLENLSEYQYVESLIGSEENAINWHLFPIRVRDGRRDYFYEKFHKMGIKVQVNYIPTYQHPVFSSYRIDPKAFPESESFYSEEISLPLFPDLTAQQVDKICKVFRE